MTPDTQLATIRCIFETTARSGVYVGDTAQFGFSLGISRADDRWDGVTPSYRGRSGQVRDVWHTITTTDYDATVAWEAALDDGAGVLGAVTQAAILVEMRALAAKLLPRLSNAYRFSRFLLVPKQQTGAHCKGSSGSATGTTIATIKDTALVGTGAGLLPPEVAAAVSLYGIGNRRKSRGRFYFGALANDAVTQGGVLNATLTDALGGNTKDALVALNGLSARDSGGPGGDRFLAWVHNPSGDPMVGSNPPTGSPIATVRVDDRPDSQRRRQHAYEPTKDTFPVSGW